MSDPNLAARMQQTAMLAHSRAQMGDGPQASGAGIDIPLEGIQAILPFQLGKDVGAFVAEAMNSKGQYIPQVNVGSTIQLPGLARQKQSKGMYGF